MEGTGHGTTPAFDWAECWVKSRKT